MRASRRAVRRTRASAPHLTASGLVMLMEDLVCDIVAVLLRIEDPPPRLERLWLLGAQNALHRWVSIRDVDAGNLIIPVILEAVSRDSAEGRVQRGGSVAALRQEAQWRGRRWITVVNSQVQDIG